jgi:hypothetical protein
VLCPFHYFCFVYCNISWRPESSFRDAGQYVTVTAFPFSVLLETFVSAVVKLAVLLSFPQLLYSKVMLFIERECTVGTATVKTFCIYQMLG